MMTATAARSKRTNYFHAFCVAVRSVISSSRSALGTSPTVFNDLLHGVFVNMSNRFVYYPALEDKDVRREWFQMRVSSGRIVVKPQW